MSSGACFLLGQDRERLALRVAKIILSKDTFLETPLNTIREKGTPESASLVTAVKTNKGGRPRIAEEMKADKYKPMSRVQADALTHKVAQLEGKLVTLKAKSDARQS